MYTDDTSRHLSAIWCQATRQPDRHAGERQTRYVMLVKVANKDRKTVVNALVKSVRRLRKQLYRSLTWDRGSEMAMHRHFTLATHIQIYFCDPNKPWQRGSNENTNRLLRQYFAKGMDLERVASKTRCRGSRVE